MGYSFLEHGLNVFLKFLWLGGGSVALKDGFGGRALLCHGRQMVHCVCNFTPMESPRMSFSGTLWSMNFERR